MEHPSAFYGGSASRFAADLYTAIRVPLSRQTVESLQARMKDQRISGTQLKTALVTLNGVCFSNAETSLRVRSLQAVLVTCKLSSLVEVASLARENDLPRELCLGMLALRDGLSNASIEYTRAVLANTSYDDLRYAPAH